MALQIILGGEGFVLGRHGSVAGGPLGGIEGGWLHRVVVHAVVDGSCVVHGVGPILLLVQVPLLERCLDVGGSLLGGDEAAGAGNA